MLKADAVVCEVCKIVMSSPDFLIIHMVNRHFVNQLVSPEEKSPATDYACGLCDKKFRGFQAINRFAIHRAGEHGALAPVIREWRLTQVRLSDKLFS